LTRDNNSRSLLGAFWQDTSIHHRAKRRLLQSIGYQFPCAKLLNLWGIRENDEYRLCMHIFPDVTAWQESLGHIQARSVLTKPRIAVHHGIWRELLTAINQNSTETHDNRGEKWFFPSDVNEASHIESHIKWTVRQIVVHFDLFSTPRTLHEEIVEFHALKLGIKLSKAEILTFWACRPDGVAFNAEDKECVFLEFTHPMDSVTSSEEGDWAERKEAEKDARYAHHRYFINYLSAQRGRQWKCTQVNFTVGF